MEHYHIWQFHVTFPTTTERTISYLQCTRTGSIIWRKQFFIPCHMNWCLRISYPHNTWINLSGKSRRIDTFLRKWTTCHGVLWSTILACDWDKNFLIWSSCSQSGKDGKDFSSTVLAWINLFIVKVLACIPCAINILVVIALWLVFFYLGTSW